VITKILAINLPKEINQQQKINILHSVGLGPTEISNILNTTPGTVKVALNRAKKKKKT